MLTVENLEVSYGDVRALDGVSLEVAEGAIVAIVGANGAGKTTLIRTIAGMLRPARGRICCRGCRTSPDWPIASGLQSRHRAGGRGPPGVSDADRAGEPGDGRDAAARARRRDAKSRARARDVSEACRASRAGGRHAVRRRAADARHRPLPDGQARPRDVRRAVARPRARPSCRRCCRPSAISTAMA